MTKNSILIAAALLAAVGVFLWMVASGTTGFGDEDAKQLFASLGYEIRLPAEEVKSMQFPQTMNPIYAGYNELQKKAGYDITPYLGKMVVRRTYHIINYSESDQINVLGHLFIYDNQVIAGDITNVALSGFMHPLLPR